MMNEMVFYCSLWISFLPRLYILSFAAVGFLHERAMSPRLTCVDVTVVNKDLYSLVLTGFRDTEQC